jgi:hypothetical protein
MENLLQGLDEHAESLTKEELQAELRERGIDTERFLSNARATISAAQKEYRLAWMKVADQKKQQIQSSQSAVVSWLNKTEQEIRAAYAQLTTSVAFRNKRELSVEDMAELLDAQERLRLRKSENGNLESE